MADTLLDTVDQQLEMGAFDPECRAKYADLAELLINRSNVMRRLRELEQHPLLRPQLDRLAREAESARAAAGLFRRLDAAMTRGEGR